MQKKLSGSGGQHNGKEWCFRLKSCTLCEPQRPDSAQIKKWLRTHEGWIPNSLQPKIRIPIPNKNLGCGYKENMDKGLTHCTKMGADSLAQNTPNAPEFICPICLSKSKSSGFQWKKALWPSIVRGLLFYASLPFSIHYIINYILIVHSAYD